MDDEQYLRTLQAALVAETDPREIERLQSALDVFVENRVKRARTVPVTKSR